MSAWLKPMLLKGWSMDCSQAAECVTRTQCGRYRNWEQALRNFIAILYSHILIVFSKIELCNEWELNKKLVLHYMVGKHLFKPLLAEYYVTCSQKYVKIQQYPRKSSLYKSPYILAHFKSNHSANNKTY